jgi:hypothetical protein
MDVTSKYPIFPSLGVIVVLQDRLMKHVLDRASDYKV